MPSGFTNTYTDALTLVKPLVKNMPTSTVDAAICNAVSIDMYRYRPWSWTVTAIAAGTIPLVDGTQDYSPPANLFRLLYARLVRTDTTPNQSLELTTRKQLAPDLIPRAWNAVTCISNEDAVGKLRLESAVQVPTGMTAQIQGEYQIYHTKVTATSQQLWFPDQYLHVLMNGLLAWYYRLSDDDRAVEAFKLYQLNLQEMAIAEDFPATDQFFPDDPLGVGRQYTGALYLYGW